jgi:hypothetical protein
MTQQAGLICHTFSPLRVEETGAEVVVSGGTFRFAFARANGLITSVRTLGREWLSRRPVPDLWCSAAVDPRKERWEAARETQAEVHVREQSGERVVIEARGRYLSGTGALAPIRYHLRYTIDCDGVAQVEVENTGTERGALRWLVFSAGAVRRGMVNFYSHIGDLATTEDTGGWETHLLPQAAETQSLYAARIVPWLQLGNDSAGLDLVMDYAEEISHGWTDSAPQADPLGRPGTNFVLEADGSRVRWTYFSIRNLFTPVRAGWRRYNRFYLSPVPAKHYQPRLADLRVHWLGPHQWHDAGFSYPSDDGIAELARRGINVIVGGAHWRSGDYAHPDDLSEIRRVIAACHDNGIRIIPYITFTDLEHDTPAFPDHGQEWQIEPVAEYRHQTNLMCYGAEGWREHWKRDVDTILERFDFDGLYIDFWVGKMACRNLLHGCGHKYPRFTLAGLREMAWHAFRGVKAKGAGQFILANTNLFAGALINNLVDIRLPGEWANIEETPEELIRGHLNSRRLGCNALLLRRPEVSLRSVSFWLRCQSPMVLTHGRSAEAMPALLMRYGELLRFFGIGGAETQSAFEQDGSLEWTGPDATVYWSRGDRGALLVLANLAGVKTQGALRIAKPAALGISPRKPYLMYRPDREQLAGEAPLLGREVRSFDLSLRPYEPALFFLTPYLGRPQVLWATHSDGIEDEQYDGHRGRLSFVVKGAPGGRSQVTVYAGGVRAAACSQGDAEVRSRRRGGLVIMEVACNEPVEMTFAPGAMVEDSAVANSLAVRSQ